MVPPLYRLVTAVITASIPRVTMNGGKRNCVTSSPDTIAIAPHAIMPTASPIGEGSPPLTS